MTATLTFMLPEEASEHRDALDGTALRSALFDLDQQLRAWTKHGHRFKSADDALDAARAALLEELAASGLSLYV